MAEYTESEVRQQFLESVHSYINDWDSLPDKTTRERLEGLAFSILVILDGEASLPRFIVAPNPHPDDKKYHQEHGESWYPQNHEAKVSCDIAGRLHELFYQETS